MKLSVLLPTRNGGRYLGDCVTSVLAADLDEIELVVSDNASEDSTREVLAEFAEDPRLHVIRQSELLSVTDNWTAAMQAASGDHLLLIGDDDCVLPGGLESIVAAHADVGAPEVLSYEAYGYAFPGAFDVGSPAHYADPLYPYDKRVPSEGPLSAAIRAWCVGQMFHFESTFSPNLQRIVCSRQTLERLPHGPFQEPYPDFYATMALLLKAESWVHLPRKLVVIGISPKSFGRTLKGGGTDAGRAYLGIDTEFDGYLPGHDIINGLHLTLQRLKRDFPGELEGVEISRSDYVYRQVYSWYLFSRLGNLERKQLARRLRMLSLSDWAGFVRELLSRLSIDMVKRHARVDDSSAVGSVWPDMRPAPEHDTIKEFARWAGERERLNREPSPIAAAGDEAGRGALL